MGRPIATAPPPVALRKGSWCRRSRAGLLSNYFSSRIALAGWFGQIGRHWFLAFWLFVLLSLLPVDGPWLWSCVLPVSKLLSGTSMILFARVSNHPVGTGRTA